MSRALGGSVRNRLFLVVAGLAVLATGSIAAAYVATDLRRAEVRRAESVARQLSAGTLGLAVALHDQEAGLDDYLLSGDRAGLNRYDVGVEAATRLAERMRVEARSLPESATITGAIDGVADAAASWRRTLAEPAIEGSFRPDDGRLRSLEASVARDQEGASTAISTLSDALGSLDTSIRAESDAVDETRMRATAVGIALMLVGAGASLVLVNRWVSRPLRRLVVAAEHVEAGADEAFPHAGGDELGQLGRALERMRVTLRDDAATSTVLNRFTEVTAFAPDDASVAASNLDALQVLVAPDAAVVHVLNRSKDRAVPEASLGPAIAEVLPLNALSTCPGVLRGSLYVAADLTEPLSVRCPIYPADRGTVACVPLAHGEMVGAIHLAWNRPNAFAVEQRPSVTRIAEHAALAIGNRRLLSALEGMANTDARTGLPNTRAFDRALEEALAALRPDEALGLLMLDLDHFKDFNDRYGHPAGDEALRAFAEILRSSIRDGDVAARYGGEEFCVMLPGVDGQGAAEIAERIRSRTESTIVSLAPGSSGRLTVSIGIACAPTDAHGRVALLRLADQALYRAKEAGRNRIERVGVGAADVRGLKPLSATARAS